VTASTGHKRGRVWLWVLVLVVLVVLPLGIATRDLWREPEALRLQKPDLRSYAGVEQFAKAGPEQPGSPAAVWKEVLGPAHFMKPEFQNYEASSPPSDPCPKPKGFRYSKNAYYCSASRTIYWDEADLKRYHEAYGHVRTLLLFAHEYGHHVSYLRGRQTVFSVQEELQADCFAGIYFRRAFGRRAFHPLDPNLSSEKLKEGVAEWFDRTDEPKRLNAWFEPGLHGSSKRRTIAFRLGFGLNSLRLCELIHQNFGLRQIGTVGLYQVAVVKGTDIEEVVTRSHIRVTRDRSQAEVRYLATTGRVSVEDAYERFRLAVANDRGVSDLTLSFLEDPRHVQDRPAYSQRRYQRVHVEDGERLVSHGVVRLVVRKGDVMAFDTRAAGSAPAVDAESWRPMEDYLQELYEGTSWWFSERRRGSK
jgi:predicted metalloprotease